jgi:tripartite ATP-independent transporter DctP family solute receptor
MITKRRLLAGTGSVVLATPALPRFALAAPEYPWRLGHTAPEGFPLHKRLVEAAAEIGEKSEGRIELTIKPDSLLGGQLGLLSQVRAGTVEMTPVTGQSLAGVLGPMFVQSVGFAFAGYEKLWPALDGDLGKALRNQVQQRLGMVARARCWDFGFRQIATRKKPVKVAADLEGLKIRTPIDPDLVGLFQALKAAPLGMNLQDLMPALQAGAVDAQDGILPLVQAAQLFEQQRFCSMTNHTWDGQWLCINAKAWGRLPDKLKDVVAAALDKGAVAQRADTLSGEAEVRTALTAQGMTFNAVEPATFRAVLRSAGYYEKAKLRVGEELWGLLEKYSGRLA